MNRLTMALGLVFVGCGGPSEPDKDLAKAFAAPDPHEQAKLAEANMKRMKEEAAKEAELAQKQEWDALLVVPADAPGGIEAACATMLGAYDAFMQQRMEGAERERWNAIKEADLDKAAAACRDGGEPKVPACQAHAFAHAPPTYDATSAPDILDGCRKKFGPPAPGSGGS
jgi:hypothetical protein